MAHVPVKNSPNLKFQLSRKDLYSIVRINARRRTFRKVAVPTLAGLVFLGHSLDGKYMEGLVWALGVAALYWGLSNLMFILNVYASANESFLVPQEITLHDDRMVVASEHSTEEFTRPDPAEVKVGDRYIVIPMGRSSLVFLKNSFEKPKDFEILRDWLKNTHSGPGN